MSMLRTRRQAVVGPLAVAAAVGLGRGAKATPQDPIAGRTLIFDEGFQSINPLIWQAGPKATTFDTGFYGRSAFARMTGEGGFNPYAIVDDVLASDGKALEITARHIGKRMNVPAYYGNELPEFQWISGNLQAAKPDGTVLKGWRQGYFEARMHVPRHPLTWPAFLLMNGRSILFPRTSIELDVMEHKGWETDLYGAYLHEWGQPGEHHEGVGVPTGVDVTKGYHRYGMLVDGADCSLFFDGRPVADPKTGRALLWRIGRADEMDRNGDVFWPLVTLALRSDVPYPSPLRDEDRVARLRIDYVRVYS